MGLDASGLSQIDQLFHNIDRQNLDPQQRIAIRALRNRIREEQLQMPAITTSQSQKIVEDVLLCASGVLDDHQFRNATGSPKNPQQQLRYEIRQLHAEFLLLEGIIKQLNR